LKNRLHNLKAQPQTMMKQLLINQLRKQKLQ